jgi:phosphohistidine phosphatase
MELYILRHGIATDPRPGLPDSARELTSEGREKVAAVARMARKAGVEPSLILTSPYVRAVQTAKIAADELGYSSSLIKTESLVPFGTPQGVWDEVRDHPGESAVLVSGHEPLLSQLVGHLLNAPSLQVGMKQAALVRIDVPGYGAAPRGALRWMITARLASLL